MSCVSSSCPLAIKKKSYTGPVNNTCTWFGEVGFCCCLPLLHQLACIILATTYKYYFRAQYKQFNQSNIVQTSPILSKLVRTHPHWSRFVQTHPASSILVKTDPSLYRLVLSCPHLSRFIKTRLDSYRLVQSDQL